MRFGIFYEHQLPRPWEPESEHRLLTDALDDLLHLERVLGHGRLHQFIGHRVDLTMHLLAEEVQLPAGPLLLVHEAAELLDVRRQPGGLRRQGPRRRA